MARFYMREECGGSEYFEAEDMKEARAVAEEWVQDGEYGDKSCYVGVYLVEVDDDDEEIGEGERFSVLVDRETVEPDCDSEEGIHDWQSPYELLGGCQENPGVWGIGGTQITSKEVCANCGMYKIYTSESTPGNYPIEPAYTEYEDADDASLDWVAGLKRLHS